VRCSSRVRNSSRVGRAASSRISLNK
jgi:hypothetical protein